MKNKVIQLFESTCKPLGGKRKVKGAYLFYLTRGGEKKRGVASRRQGEAQNNGKQRPFSINASRKIPKPKEGE